jgi:hypothetical protein
MCVDVRTVFREEIILPALVSGSLLCHSRVPCRGYLRTKLLEKPGEDSNLAKTLNPKPFNSTSGH